MASLNQRKGEFMSTYYLGLKAAQEVKKETEKAVLIGFQGVPVWIPKSQCLLENGAVAAVKRGFLPALNKPELFDVCEYKYAIHALKRLRYESELDDPALEAHYENFGDR